MADDVRERPQDVVPELVAEAVVDRLEVVQIGQDEREAAAKALHPADLVLERLLEAAPVRELREVVGDRLARQDPVQPCVLERDRGLRGERIGGGEGVLPENRAGLRVEEQHLDLAALPGAERDRHRLAADIGVTGPHDALPSAKNPCAGRFRRLDSAFRDDGQKRLGLVSRCQRGPEPVERPVDPETLGSQLGTAALELTGHVVERLSELRELVASTNRHSSARGVPRRFHAAAPARSRRAPTMARPGRKATAATTAIEASAASTSLEFTSPSSLAIVERGVSARRTALPLSAGTGVAVDRYDVFPMRTSSAVLAEHRNGLADDSLWPGDDASVGGEGEALLGPQPAAAGDLVQERVVESHGDTDNADRLAPVDDVGSAARSEGWHRARQQHSVRRERGAWRRLRGLGERGAILGRGARPGCPASGPGQLPARRRRRARG